MSSPSPVNGNTRVHIGFGRLVAYSALQLPLAMAALPVVLNVAHYYGEVLKLSLALIGPILIVSRIIDAVQDPILGYISLGRGITIHREDCPNAKALKKNPERLAPIDLAKVEISAPAPPERQVS